MLHRHHGELKGEMSWTSSSAIRNAERIGENANQHCTSADNPRCSVDRAQAGEQEENVKEVGEGPGEKGRPHAGGGASIMGESAVEATAILKGSPDHCG